MKKNLAGSGKMLVDTFRVCYMDYMLIGNEIALEEPNEEKAHTLDSKDNEEIKSIHYISWMFGILFTCGLVSLITIIPQHNILKEPDYWYEAMIEGTGSSLTLTSGALYLSINFKLDLLSNR